MSTASESDLELEIAHVLLIDVVGYSKLLVNAQIELLQELNRIVRHTPRFVAAEASGKLMRLPTGDGMALLFFDSAMAPVQCALEISVAAKENPAMQLRMGLHSGPIKEVKDVNDRSNFAGAGINLAQRVLDCGDAGHILLSERIAEDLRSYEQWHPHLHDLGRCEVKHGLQLHLFNLCKEGVGNPAIPERVRCQQSETATRAAALRRWIAASPGRKAALLAAAALFLAAIAGSLFFRSPQTEATDREGRAIAKQSIAVLPFSNRSDDPANAYFADGVQDEILTDLAKLADLKVISRTSVMQYLADVKRDVREIGKTLGVAHVLEGSVQRIGDRVRVHAQLIETETDRQLWANHYDRELSDVFAIQSEVAEQIVAQLQRQLSPSEKAAIEAVPTTNLAAYERYIRAKNLIDGAVFSARGSEDLLQAAQLLNEAVALDPAFAMAHYQLADAQDHLYLRYDQSPARLALADSAIRTLQRLRPDSGEAHLALAKHLYWGYLEYDRARRELALAEAKLPNNPTPPLLRGFIDRRQGKWEESTKNLKRALELDPQNYSVLQQLSISYQNQRQFAAMAATLDQAVALAPSDLALGAQRAAVELEARADPKPLHRFLASVLATKPAASAVIADQRFYLALCERDLVEAGNALRSPESDACATEGVPLPHAWCEGVVARLAGDEVLATAKFNETRTEVAKMLAEQPDSGVAHCALGMAEAALGSAAEAVRDGQRALQLLPVSKDAIRGANLMNYFAVICAWSGQTDMALETLGVVTTTPGTLSYGNLRLHPYWDPLRGDPRFEAIVASLAPKD
ncbi:MAG: hypothetical protein ACR2ID_01120 [Chthoniobacterales bacterium]